MELSLIFFRDLPDSLRESSSCDFKAGSLPIFTI